MQNRFVKNAPLGASAAYSLAAGAPIVALIVRLPFSGFLANKAPYATFLIAAGACASFGGFGPGLCATVFGAVLASVFIVSPFDSLPDFGTLVVFLGLSVLLSYVCARLVDATRQESALRVVFQQTLSSIGDGVISVDNDARVRLMNPVAEQLTGWSEAEAKGQPLADVFRIAHEGSNIPIQLPLERVKTREELVTIPVLTDLIAKSGERNISTTASPRCETTKGSS
jgi:PAS domain S-box-containing protein